MKFVKLIETRFADPVTAVDLSLKYVCYGSAMGRIAFYSIREDKDIVLFDCQPELIRGISHSEDGNSLYISIGDVSCQKLDAQDLRVLDNVLIVEDIDERAHKSNCERSFTLMRRHHNCVISINMQDRDDPQNNRDRIDPLNISNLESSMLETHKKESGLDFNQNTVPFDFDGTHLIWMAYLPHGIREIYSYHTPSKIRDTLLRFSASDGIISHAKLIGSHPDHLTTNKEDSGRNKNLVMFYVKNSTQIIRYDIESKTTTLIGQTRESILALDVSEKKLRSVDRAAEENKFEEDDPEQQGQSPTVIVAVDDTESVYYFDSSAPSKTHGWNCQRQQIKQADGCPQTVKNKDLFGMGYPYFITSYGGFVAVSTDYGITLLQHE